MNLPRGTQIHSNEDSMNMAGGGSKNVTVNVDISGIMSRSKADERDIAKNFIKTCER